MFSSHFSGQYRVWIQRFLSLGTFGRSLLSLWKDLKFIPGHVFKDLFLGAFDKLVDIQFGAKSLQFTPRCQFKNCPLFFCWWNMPWIHAQHEFKHLRLMLSLFGGNTLDFMICSPSSFFFRQSMNLRTFPQVLPYLVCSSFTSVRNVWNFYKKWATQIQKWKQWKTTYTQIANWTDAKLAPNKLFRPHVAISGQMSLFRAKCPYFGPNVLISGQMSLFRANCPYFGPNVLISGQMSLFQRKIP